jgi:hypothetical protein
MKQWVYLVISIFVATSCTPGIKREETNARAIEQASLSGEGTFAYDLAFLSKYDSILVLSGPGDMARIIVSPRMQGRIMTSASGGLRGKSYGWVNYELIHSRKFEPHINVFGGEDRIWLGPEGGQFSVFFKKNDPFDLTYWQTPVAVDTEAFQVVSHTIDRVQLKKTIQLQNYSGTQFQLQVERNIRLLSPAEISQLLGYKITDSLQAVGFESDNRIINTGKDAWKKSTGLLSVWILGMFNPSPATTIVIPFKEGTEKELGPPVNDAYFGNVPDDRLEVQNDVLFFKADGQQRGKIGISPKRAKRIFGSYDAKQGVLTLVQFNMPENTTSYVNSMWEIQKEPYAGDVINSYNDGPTTPGGKPLGPFYELETSSPAVELQPGSSLSHVHRTFHFEGSIDELDKLSQAALGVSLQEIVKALL